MWNEGNAFDSAVTHGVTVTVKEDLVAICGVLALWFHLPACGGKAVGLGVDAATGSTNLPVVPNALADAAIDSSSEQPPQALVAPSVGEAGSLEASDQSSVGDGGPQQLPTTRDSGSGDGDLGAVEAGFQCETADDCAMFLGPLPGGVCVINCPDDGGEGCEHYVCLSGVCHSTFCGTESGSSANECSTALDCETLLGPLPAFCIYSCPSGEGCEHYLCLSGICQTTFCN
jgi:hypothetical protein